jgi:hypothetical protein
MTVPLAAGRLVSICESLNNSKYDITCHKYCKIYIEERNSNQYFLILGKHCWSGKLTICFHNIKI